MPLQIFKTMKDFSDLIEALQDLNRSNSPQAYVDDLQSMEELEKEYIEFSKQSKDLKFNFGSWIPSLQERMRALVPGEVCTILADTGVGKTTILHNIAMKCAPLKTILFEIELPGTLTFERFLSLQTQKSSSIIESTYEAGNKIEWKKTSLNHIFTCSKSKLTMEDIERIITNSPSKIGGKPTMILVDYIGLITGKGTSRYERMSYVAEEMKKMAKATKTIIIMACQIHRKGDDSTGEIFLHDAKDSGSIENSSGIVLGAWREGKEGEIMKLKILKQTKGKSGGYIVDCNFNGETSLITQFIPSLKQVYALN